MHAQILTQVRGFIIMLLALIACSVYEEVARQVICMPALQNASVYLFLWIFGVSSFISAWVG